MTRFDKETLDWFKDHREEQTTLCKCEACGLFYKPELGHKCKKEHKNEDN